ncbi:hypothetical protein ACJX0J_016753 [Zea mays]
MMSLRICILHHYYQYFVITLLQSYFPAMNFNATSMASEMIIMLGVLLLWFWLHIFLVFSITVMTTFSVQKRIKGFHIMNVSDGFYCSMLYYKEEHTIIFKTSYLALLGQCDTHSYSNGQGVVILWVVLMFGSSGLGASRRNNLLDITGLETDSDYFLIIFAFANTRDFPICLNVLAKIMTRRLDGEHFYRHKLLLLPLKMEIIFDFMVTLWMKDE